MEFKPLKIMADPDNAGRHEYHDNRWIATADAVVERGHDPRSWGLSEGSLICEMRDVDPAYARLFSVAPKLLEACEAMAECESCLVEDGFEKRRISKAIELAKEAIDEIKGN